MSSLHAICGCGAVHGELGSCPERWSRRGVLRSGAMLTAGLIAGYAVPGQISTLYRSIRPAVEQAGANLEAAIKANAKIQAGLLATSSPVLAEAIKKNELKIVAAYYDLATGAVTLL